MKNRFFTGKTDATGEKTDFIEKNDLFHAELLFLDRSISVGFSSGEDKCSALSRSMRLG